MNKTIRKIGIVAGAILMTGLTAPLLIPVPLLEGTVAPEDLADSDSRFVKAGEVTLHYKRKGLKPPVFILLHGYLGGTFSWTEILGPLSELGTAIAYDRPAFGLTSRPMPGEWRGSSPYGYQMQAVMLIKMMDALEIGRATLIAHGMGCGVAALAARMNADRVERLIMISPESNSGGRPGWQRLFMATPQMRRIGPVMLRNKVVGQMEEMLRKAWHNPSLISTEKREAYYKLLRVNDWDRALWELARAARPLAEICPLEKLELPALIVAGEEDRMEGTGAIIRLAAQMPRAQLAVLPGAGNCPHEESPAPFLQALSEYIAITQGSGM